MAKAEGINLDVQPHHVKRGAAQTAKSRARERRVDAALLGKEVIIRAEHRSNGGKARKRAVAREKAQQATPIPTAPRSRDSASLEPTGEAMLALLRVFGYPTKAQPVTPTRIYRCGEMDEDRDEPELGAPKRLPRKPEEVRRRTATGVMERSCSCCREWQPETTDYYRYRQKRAFWESECHKCHESRRREYYERHRA